MVSVVVPVYNGANYLKACLDSVAAAAESVAPERRSQLEVVVCDNHSNDASGEIAEAARFACASQIVRPTQHESNRTRNWRTGLDAATGTWAMMVHADDLLARNGLTALLDAAANPAAVGASLVVGRHRTFQDDERPSGLHPRWILPSVISGPRLAKSVLPFHCPFVPFTLMRAELYEEVGGLDERWELVQDWELWMRLAARGDALYVPQEIGSWRLHGSSEAYMRLNAREHVELAEAVERSVGALPAVDLAEAQSVARARAAIHLGEVGSDGAENSWLISRSLPSLREAEDSLRRTHRKTAIKQAAFRVGGFPRWLHRQTMLNSKSAQR